MVTSPLGRSWGKMLGKPATIVLDLDDSEIDEPPPKRRRPLLPVDSVESVPSPEYLPHVSPIAETVEFPHPGKIAKKTIETTFGEPWPFIPIMSSQH